MFPDISLVPSFSVDLSGEIFGLDTNYSIIPKNEDHLFYLLAILNSFVLEIYYKYQFQTLSKEYRFKTFLVNKIPIFDPERINEGIFDKIITLSKNLYQNHEFNIEYELNSLIKELYQIDDKEYSYILADLKREQ